MRALRGKSTDAIAHEAAEWVVRMGVPDPSEDERRQFVDWLKRSPVHVEHYLQMESTWSGLGHVDPERRTDLKQLVESSDWNVVEFPSELERRPSPLTHVPVYRRLSHSVMAGVLAIALAVGGWIWWSSDRPAHYATGIGEQRTLKLADGSTVTLNTHSRLTARLGTRTRDIVLLEGEAYFKVMKDEKRPFRVTSDRALVQALGTEFVVRREALSTAVTVVEGRVSVARAADVRHFGSAVPTRGKEESVHLDAGHRADVDDAEIRTRNVAHPENVLAWQSRRLIFEGDTLADAVAEFNRYNTLQLSLQDSALSRERISGVFDADQPMALVRFLEQAKVVRAAAPVSNVMILQPLSP